MTRQSTYAIGQLADLAGVSRRTVRYYVQEGLIPEPSGLGRGAHYTQEHLNRLLRVKALQEEGLTLDQVRQRLFSQQTSADREIRTVLEIDRSHWTRLEVIPGVELHVASSRQIPPPGKLRDLAEWCRRHFRETEKGR